MTIRYLGKNPYLAAVVHGGPGGIGSAHGLARGLSAYCGVLEPLQSAHGLARGLSAYCGVLEPLQSAYSVEGQVEELREQIGDHGPLILIGHSWGAWLAAMVAARYPKRVKQLILVGCGALDEKYLPQLVERRLAHLDAVEKEQYFEAIKHLDGDAPDKDAWLRKLGELADKADTYSSLDEVFEIATTDGEMYAKVWPEAAQMRQSGELLELFKKIKCPITVIHGDYDTTPPEAVTEPLKRAGIEFTTHILEKCGHTPWHEKYTRDKFFQILSQIVKAGERDF